MPVLAMCKTSAVIAVPAETTPLLQWPPTQLGRSYRDRQTVDRAPSPNRL